MSFKKLKESEMEVKKYRSMENKKKFFGLMGEFFASKEVRKELGGYPMNDDVNYVWFVLQKANGDVMGFLSMEDKKDKTIIHDFYMIHKFRKKGFFRMILNEAIKYAEERKLPIEVKVLEDVVNIFKNRGFKEVNKKGKWYTLKKEFPNVK